MMTRSKALVAGSSLFVWLWAFAYPVWGDEVWTLETSIRRTFEVAPEVRAAQAGVHAREAELTQAGAWPNPSVQVRADDRLGKDDGSGGYDFTQFALTQPLTRRRLARQREVAQALLAGAQANASAQRLALEHEIARVFHEVQNAAAALAAAEQRVQLTERLGQPETGRRDPLIRVLTPLDRLRLQILRESAQQALATAEGEHNEALSRFKALLLLPSDTAVTLTPLDTLPAAPALDAMHARLAHHPALTALAHDEDAARANVEAARAQRLADPAVTLFRERDFLGGRRQDINGVGLSVQVPLWHRNLGGVEKAKAEVDRAQAQQQAKQRDFAAQLRQSYLHLQHLIEQARRYRTELLEPAQRLFERTRRAFGSGEINVLALVDASNTYFDAHKRYTELLHDAWLETATLRLAAGVSALEVTP